MSGAFDYAPINFELWTMNSSDYLIVRASGIVINHDNFWAVGDALQFYNLAAIADIDLDIDTTYYIKSLTGNGRIVLSLAPGGTTLDITQSYSNFSSGWVRFLPKAFGDACFKPRLLAAEKTRIFNKWATQYKAPPPANQLALGYTYDEVTGTLDLPSEADVRQGVTFDGESRHGSLVVPDAGAVRSGTIFDNGTVGRCNVPGTQDVLFGVISGDLDETPVPFGRLIVPGNDDVREGVLVGDFANPLANKGTLIVPDEVDVRYGVVFDAVTIGSLNLPSEVDVRNGVKFDNETKIGVLDLPNEVTVVSGIVYDNGTKTGAYTPDLPTPEELKLGIIRGVNDPGGPITGTYAGEPLYPPQQVHVHLAPIPQRLEVSLA